MTAYYGHGWRPSAHMYQGQQSYNWLNSYNPRAPAPAPAAPEFYQKVAPPAAFNGQQQGGGGGGGGGGSSSYGQPPFGSGSARSPQMYPPPQRPLFPPDTDPEIVTEFRMNMNQNGMIEAAELKRMLSSQDNPFSHRTVRLMLHLFAENRADTSRIGRW